MFWMHCRNPSRFVMVGEDAALFELRPYADRLKRVMGWHKDFSRHSMAFRDGHAEGLRMDTTKYRESSWTVIDESLPAPVVGGS